jgi:enhancer of polycomb-like protein
MFPLLTILLLLPLYQFQNPSLQPKAKLEIPTPNIIDVEDYDKHIPANYQPPVSYVRYSRSTTDELVVALEYVIDAEDEVWLLNNTKFGGSAGRNPPPPTKADSITGTSDEQRKVVTTPRPKLPLDYLERMMDVMEKATGFETIITVDEAERRILHMLPDLLYRFPTKARAGITTLKHVLQDVYTYWVQKRSKLKRPLIRRFWPVTASDDTNPHLVFRPREKEKYKLRKKRSNDMEGT